MRSRYRMEEIWRFYERRSKRNQDGNGSLFHMLGERMNSFLFFTLCVGIKTVFI